MRIDAERVKAERGKRAWTQEHLAKVSGIGLRTIQRIESTAAASADSVQALAATFELTVADLAPEPRESVRRPRFRKPLLALPWRLALAALSGAAAQWVFAARLEHTFDVGWIGYALPGVLFAAGVTYPHLHVAPGLLRRALALVCASTLSFFCAVQLLDAFADAQGGAMSWEAALSSPVPWLTASALGAGIVLASARFLVPFAATGAYWLCGGAALYLGWIVAASSDRSLLFALAFAAWHAFMCLVLELGSDHSTAGLRIAAALRAAGERMPLRQYWSVPSPEA